MLSPPALGDYATLCIGAVKKIFESEEEYKRKVRNPN
jgi:hypothetical protein